MQEQTVVTHSNHVRSSEFSTVPPSSFQANAISRTFESVLMIQ